MECKVLYMYAWNDIEALNLVNKELKSCKHVVLQEECAYALELLCDNILCNGDTLMFYNGINIVARLRGYNHKGVAVKFSWFEKEKVMFIDLVEREVTEWN